ncbi:DUF3375 domain-containing protein [Pseudomonas sp. CCI3.2]|uniref:DUF3375 domain-containing protein n=1 Tax=unclassified Pseudomonas TaxID=196821 RepID=UPI002AC90DE5|nr:MULTISPECIES: DUF3375 domain-containing protein [unclassified Pseudomonas]MEB0077749.1 DUF3375 domain-containing protein [Pseudomonas sp. MH10out]MEB0092438.1 DUF3375 domain-containing protein [Pseudomonas sp. CCI4.2]MEB0102862.1 DUF3375 domain-containing protein [Pseudomonas sp. CCI3.2]MEB0123951.1 DUF3375 domain-containing protein [Pseudomonas sp. CCI1.2]MEB0130755.1 DUF3375 domain-containing protein [Pseudomonas sp. CCI2.4]
MIDYSTLEAMLAHHPAWRLLRSGHAPLVASFLYQAFVVTNVRVVSAADLAEALEDELYVLRRRLGGDAFPKSALFYLDEWASPDKGWLRKFYRQGSDEPQFDLTPSTEKAITWLESLTERSFVGTESRLLTLFELLKQMSEGSEADPAKRVAELQKRRDDIDAEIVQILAGDVPLLDSTALKDRFQQFTQLARELLSDFREVEHNFRLLDRRVRERIALWDGAKGALLEEIMGQRDAISDSDQGRSFKAFWAFLMSSRRQEELTDLLDRVLALAPVVELKPDIRTRRVHYDWLEAGEHTQRTVAQLSHQLRRFLDDKVWLENRRIMDILRGIEAKTLGVRDNPPPGNFMDIAELVASFDLPMERPLHTPALSAVFADIALMAGDEDLDAGALYSQVVVDCAQLAAHIRHALQDRTQISLRELTQLQPIEQGLAELVAYLQLGTESFNTVIDENTPETIYWEALASDGTSVNKQALLPRIIFVR